MELQIRSSTIQVATGALKLTSLLALATIFILPLSSAQNVKPPAQFRNNPAHTGEADEKTLSSSNIRDLAIQWKGITHAAISSSPVVALEPIDKGLRHIAYVASQDGYLYAFNADNCHLGGNGLGGGQECPVVWRLFVGTTAVTSPAVADELIGGVQTSVVYVVGGDGYLYAINGITGTQIWSTGIGGPIAYSSPAVANGVVYVLSGGLLGALFAFDAANGGAYLWNGYTIGTGSPAVDNGMVYVGDRYGTMRAFDANGCGSSYCSQLGSLSGFGGFESSPAVSNGRVFVGSDDNNLYVFEASDQNCQSICGPLWSANLAGPVHSSPAVANGVVYVTAGNSAIGGQLYAFDANCSGPSCSTPLWTGAINGSNPTSSPEVANGVVYVTSDDGNLYAFDAKGCVSKVCSPLVTVNTHDHSGFYVSSSPTVVDGYVYVGSVDGTLYMLGTCGYVCRYDNQSLY